MSTNLCQACGTRGYTVPIESLRGLLCLPCTEAFQAWTDAAPWCLPTDWPGWVRGQSGQMAAAAQRARDRARDETNTVGTRPLNPDQLARVGAWHQYQSQSAH